MRIQSKVLMLSASLALSSTIAAADCAQDLAALETGATETAHQGIAKDGSLAPLQRSEGDTQGTAGNDHTSAEASEAVDAQVEPTESAVAPMSKTTESAGPDTNQAMSGADAQSQQSGGETAAEIAQKTPAEGEPSRSQALSEARAALDAGDEAGCLEALEGLS